jgi:hypothetical protein
VSLFLVKKSLYNIKVFLFKELIKKLNRRCPKSQPVQWNVLDDGFYDEKLGPLGLWGRKKCVVSLILVKKVSLI